MKNESDVPPVLPLSYLICCVYNSPKSEIQSTAVPNHLDIQPAIYFFALYLLKIIFQNGWFVNHVQILLNFHFFLLTQQKRTGLKFKIKKSQFFYQVTILTVYNEEQILFCEQHLVFCCLLGFVLGTDLKSLMYAWQVLNY